MRGIISRLQNRDTCLAWIGFIADIIGIMGAVDFIIKTLKPSIYFLDYRPDLLRYSVIIPLLVLVLLLPVLILARKTNRKKQRILLIIVCFLFTVIFSLSLVLNHIGAPKLSVIKPTNEERFAASDGIPCSLEVFNISKDTQIFALYKKLNAPEGYTEQKIDFDPESGENRIYKKLALKLCNQEKYIDLEWRFQMIKDNHILLKTKPVTFRYECK